MAQREYYTFTDWEKPEPFYDEENRELIAEAGEAMLAAGIPKDRAVYLLSGVAQAAISEAKSDHDLAW